MAKIKNASEELEILVSKIQQQLAPDADIKHNVKVDGRKSKIKRQIDVLVTQKIGQYDMVLAIECKDYKRSADVNVVGSFHEVLADIGAHKGALVCPSGFTEAAKNLAREHQIELYSPVDTDPHKWTVRAALPATFDFRSAAISFGFSSTSPGPFRLPYDFFDLEVYDSQGNILGKTWDVTIQKWNEGKFPTEPGDHENLEIFDDVETYIDNGYGGKAKVKLYVGLTVYRKLYFGNVPISEIKGFRDEQTGAVITNAFTANILRPEEVEETWKEISSLNDTPIEPFIGLIGLVGWPAN